MINVSASLALRMVPHKIEFVNRKVVPGFVFHLISPFLFRFDTKAEMLLLLPVVELQRCNLLEVIAHDGQCDGFGKCS